MSRDGAAEVAGLPVIGQPVPDPQWLAQSREPALDPTGPIVDPHHHFSAHWGGYGLADLLADTGSGHAVVATIHVQCGLGYRTDGDPAFAPVGETEAVVARAAGAAASPAAGAAGTAAAKVATRACAGIIGYADLRAGDAVEPVLAAHVQAGQGRFRGIRCSTARHPGFRYGLLEPPPVGLYADAGFRRGFARLARFGLTFDALCFQHQLDDVVELARAFPDQPIVLNHCGGPLGVGPLRDHRDEARAQWAAAIARVADCRNVCVKLGGLGMATTGLDFASGVHPPTSAMLADAWRPWIAHCIDRFGADRCMFESNFPVDRASGAYVTVWNAFKRLAAGATAAQWRALFHETATRVYRLESSGHAVAAERHGNPT